MQTQSLTEGSIFKTLFVFALPVLGGNVLQSLNASINSYWIGKHLGDTALTASSNANTILFVLIALMFGVTLATTILVAQGIGAKNLEQAKRVIGTGATFFFIASIAVAALGYLGTPTLMSWMKTPADAIPYANAYLRVIFLGIPFLYMYSFVMMSLRGAGDSKTPFYFLFLSVSLDVALNPLFIFGWGPIPRMGIAGSATATLIAQAFSFFALVFHLYRSKHFLRIQRHELHYLKLDKAILRAMIAKGVPMGLQMIVLSTSLIFMIRMVNPFGVQTTAAYGACNQLWNYVQMPAVAVGQAVSSMAAQNVGARKWDRVDRVALSGVIFNFILSGSVIGAILLFSHPLLGLFLIDPNAITIGQHVNAVVIWSFAFFGVNLVLSGVVRSTGAVVPPLLILFVAMWLIRIPFAYFLLDRLGANAIWYSFPVSALFSLVCAILYYRFGDWKAARMFEPSAPQTAQA